jgi:hypothetical protein
MHSYSFLGVLLLI